MSDDEVGPCSCKPLCRSRAIVEVRVDCFEDESDKEARISTCRTLLEKMAERGKRLDQGQQNVQNTAQTFNSWCFVVDSSPVPPRKEDLGKRSSGRGAWVRWDSGWGDQNR